jgi:hypothetical protein
LNAHQFQMQYQTNFLPRSTSGGGFNRTVPAVEKQFAQNGIDMRAAWNINPNVPELCYRSGRLTPTLTRGGSKTSARRTANQMPLNIVL